VASIERLRWSVLDVGVSIAFTALVGLALTPFGDRLGSYPDLELIATGAIFAAALAVQLWFGRQQRPESAVGWALLVGPFLAAALLFWGLTIGGPREESRSVAPLYLSLAMLGLLQLTLASGFQRRAATRKPPTVGLASTGILIDREAEPSFVLVLNTNLNHGKGLWVPPGGHFDVEELIDPATRAIDKIWSEIGLRADIWYATPAPHPELSTLSTAETRWLTPPSFVLDEDLLGTCSQRHERHMDFVYICRVIAGQPVAQPSRVRYAPELQLRVPVRACATGVDEALTEVRHAVEGWERNRGEQRSQSQTITRDVAQRLHLAAVAYLADGRPSS
jgi:hypothetical protein